VTLMHEEGEWSGKGGNRRVFRNMTFRSVRDTHRTRSLPINALPGGTPASERISPYRGLESRSRLMASQSVETFDPFGGDAGITRGIPAIHSKRVRGDRTGPRKTLLQRVDLHLQRACAPSSSESIDVPPSLPSPFYRIQKYTNFATDMTPKEARRKIRECLGRCGGDLAEQDASAGAENPFNFRGSLYGTKTFRRIEFEVQMWKIDGRITIEFSRRTTANGPEWMQFYKSVKRAFERDVYVSEDRANASKSQESDSRATEHESKMMESIVYMMGMDDNDLNLQAALHMAKLSMKPSRAEVLWRDASLRRLLMSLESTNTDIQRCCVATCANMCRPECIPTENDVDRLVGRLCAFSTSDSLGQTKRHLIEAFGNLAVSAETLPDTKRIVKKRHESIEGIINKIVRMSPDSVGSDCCAKARDIMRKLKML